MSVMGYLSKVRLVVRETHMPYAASRPDPQYPLAWPGPRLVSMPTAPSRAPPPSRPMGHGPQFRLKLALIFRFFFAPLRALAEENKGEPEFRTQKNWL
jgi:hypothetical protein